MHKYQWILWNVAANEAYNSGENGKAYRYGVDYGGTCADALADAAKINRQAGTELVRVLTHAEFIAAAGDAVACEVAPTLQYPPVRLLADAREQRRKSLGLPKRLVAARHLTATVPHPDGLAHGRAPQRAFVCCGLAIVATFGERKVWTREVGASFQPYAVVHADSGLTVAGSYSMPLNEAYAVLLDLLPLANWEWSVSQLQAIPQLSERIRAVARRSYRH